MGGFVSHFGRSYAAIGGEVVMALFSDTSGRSFSRGELLDLLRETLYDESGDVTARAEALVLLDAVETCLSEHDMFIFVDKLSCPYTETILRSTVLEAVVRKNPGRDVVEVGPEMIVYSCSKNNDPIRIGADAFWLRLSEDGADAAGAFLQTKLSELSVTDPIIYASSCAAPEIGGVPGVLTFTATEHASLFDKVVRENLSFSEASPADRCTMTYIHGNSMSRWLSDDGIYGSRACGVVAAVSLLSQMHAAEAARKFASLK